MNDDILNKFIDNQNNIFEQIKKEFERVRNHYFSFFNKLTRDEFDDYLKYIGFIIDGEIISVVKLRREIPDYKIITLRFYGRYVYDDVTENRFITIALNDFSFCCDDISVDNDILTNRWTDFLNERFGLSYLVKYVCHTIKNK